MIENVRKIAERFRFDGQVVSVVAFGNGHINRTYLVKTQNSSYVLQGINTKIFKTASDIINNILLLWETAPNNQIILNMIETLDGGYSIDADNALWRAVPYAGEYESFEVVDEAWKAEKAAAAFAEFGKVFAGVDVSKLKDTIPNFHNGMMRFEHLEQAHAGASAERKQKAKELFQYALERKVIFESVQQGLNDGSIPLRVTHNDTKLNNVLIGKQNRDLAKVIDLDTVMQGTLLYDFGDMVRTSVSPTKENEPDQSKITFNIEFFEAICKGFSKMKSVMTEKEKQMIVDGAKYMIFIIGVRFLTDYFNNDVYFKISYPEENFVRARNQFVLLSRLEKIEPQLREIAKKYFN